MKHAWIIKVIDDIQIYAHHNNLHQIKPSLDELRIIVAFEIAAIRRTDIGLQTAMTDPTSHVVTLPNTDGLCPEYQGNALAGCPEHLNVRRIKPRDQV